MLTGGRSLKAAPQPDADSGSDESSTPAPEACLGILPLELKARIVELAALQDERYRERWIPGAPGEKLVEVHKNAWRGRSLVALSQTSKEINELAARHLFYSITDKKPDSAYFSLRVLPHKSHHFRSGTFEIVGDVTHRITLPRILAALSLGHLTRLTHLRISHHVAYQTLNDLSLFQTPPSSADPRSSDDAALHRETFRTLASGLKALELVDFPPTAIAAILPLCPSLESVTICGFASLVDPETFSASLGGLGTLRRLTLDASSANVAAPHLDKGWCGVVRSSELRAITLINVQVSSSTVAFIDEHAPTLRHLALHLPKTPASADALPFNPFRKTHFPQLACLEVRSAQFAALEGILTSVAAATKTEAGSSLVDSSRLTELRLETRASWRDDDTLNDVLKLFKNLGRLHITGLGGKLLPRSMNWITHTYAVRGILDRTSSRRDLFLDRQPLSGITREEEESRRTTLELRHNAIKAALAFGGVLADTMLAEQDLEGTEMMLESLGDIWGRKLLRDD